jgi:hypothetical protein
MSVDNTPYDPDLTVAEALEEGLVAVIESGNIGAGYLGACGVPMKQDGVTIATCSRDVAHGGVHAFVIRWSDYSDYYGDGNMAQLERIEQIIYNRIGRVQTALQAASTGSKSRARVQNALDTLNGEYREVRVLINAEKQRAARTAKAEAKARADQEVKRMEATLRQEQTRQAKKSDPYRIEHRIDSMVAKPVAPPSWADIARTSKRNRINPKGQR